jgi:hypothetical protein
MARYKATRAYGNDKFFVKAGDVIEIEGAEAERLTADSPGTFELVDEAQATQDAIEAGLITEHGAEVKAELEAQIPTIDLDPEDKAKEIPGEGNKYTPASGYTPPDAGGVRVVERAPSDRQQKGASTRTDEVIPADQSANARVTDSTPASAAADAALLEGGVLAQEDETDDDAKTKKDAASKTTKKS